MNSRTLLIILVAPFALAKATPLAGQSPVPNILSGDLMTAGPVRTGFKHGPAPVGGMNGSIPQNLPGATHEQLVFARGSIPTEEEGGPDFEAIFGYPHEHVQDVEPIGDWSSGTAYFAVTHSQDNAGHLMILKTTQVAPAPNEHEIHHDSGTESDGEGIWHQRMHQFSPTGQYNHPHDMSAVGDILLVAAQNWAGRDVVGELAIGPDPSPDAVLFYNVSNPEQPEYIGKIEISALSPALSDLSNFWAGKIGSYYYLSLGDGGRTRYFFSERLIANPSAWSPAAGISTNGFIGDTIVWIRDEGSPEPVQWTVKPAVDDYQAATVVASEDGSVVNFGGEIRTYDIGDSAFAANGSASGVYVSKRGRMTQVSVDRGFGFFEGPLLRYRDLLRLEAYSIHFPDQDVQLPLADPILPLSDTHFWGTHPAYYETIRTADLDGDGEFEIVARSSEGLLAWQGDGTPLPGLLGIDDASGFLSPEYYQTIQAADVDGDGKDEILVRFASGLVAFSYNEGIWVQVPGIIPLTNEAGYNRPEYYRTIQAADIHGDRREEVLVRSAFGVVGYSFDGASWIQLPGGVPVSDALGLNQPQYYLTIQTADIDGDGKGELLCRLPVGLFAYKFNGLAWIQLPGMIPLSDAAGFDQPKYYGTIQAADVDGDLREEVLVRFAAGLATFTYDGATWTQLPELISLFDNAHGFDAPGAWSTIQSADFDGDGRSEVIGRYYWGLAAFRFDNGLWTLVGTTSYFGDFNGYGQYPYASTIQAANVDGDSGDELIARFRSGLYLMEPETLGFRTEPCCPVVSIRFEDDGKLWLRWQSLPGSTYRIQSSTTLDPGSFTDLTGDIVGELDATAAGISVDPSTQRRLFFRVVER